jgi:hypothetical protein
MWNNYAPDGNSIKRQLPKIDSRDKGMGWEREKGRRDGSSGRSRLRVVNRSATLQPHTAFSIAVYVIINYNRWTII